MSQPPVLRANELRRRAAILQTDVAHVVAHDATQQRETSPPEADDEQREEILPVAPEVVA